MTSITPRLNRSYRGKDDRYPVVIQVIRSRRKRELDTPFRLWEDEFNYLLNQAIDVKEHHRPAGSITQTNRFLAYLCSEIYSICEALQAKKGESYTVEDIVEVYKRRNDLTRIFVYADSLIGKLNNTGHAGTAGNYQSSCRALESFLGNRELLFSDFTPALVDRFATYLCERGNCPNTVVCYLRQLRAIYNKAVLAHVVTEDLKPFQNQAMKENQTRKRALPRKELRCLERAELTGAHEDTYLARDLFMASVYGRGISFVDLCYLTRTNIEGNYLRYRRHKTGQPLSVFIEKPLKELLTHYACPDSPYLFPMLRGGGDARKKYLNAKKRLGNRIRELGLLLGFEFPLTFHVARHTWATLAHNAGVEVSVISSGMGHTSEKTTRIYLAEMDPYKLDRANRIVLNVLV